MRPIGVSILAILIILLGALLVMGGILVLIGSGFLAFAGWTFPAELALIAGAIVLIIGIITVIAGLGLWKLEKWAWVLAILVLVFALVFPLVTRVFSPCTIVIEVVLLIYLLLIRNEFH